MNDLKNDSGNHHVDLIELRKPYFSWRSVTRVVVLAAKALTVLRQYGEVELIEQLENSIPIAFKILKIDLDKMDDILGEGD